VKQGDIVADFDALTLRRTLQDKQSELRQAQAELAQARTIQDRPGAEQHRHEQGRLRCTPREARRRPARHRAAADVERSKLAVVDSEQRLKKPNKRARNLDVGDLRPGDASTEDRQIQADIDQRSAA